jgi:hypothetical protein
MALRQAVMIEAACYAAMGWSSTDGVACFRPTPGAKTKHTSPIRFPTATIRTRVSSKPGLRIFTPTSVEDTKAIWEMFVKASNLSKFTTHDRSLYNDLLIYYLYYHRYHRVYIVVY